MFLERGKGILAPSFFLRLDADRENIPVFRPVHDDLKFPIGEAFADFFQLAGRHEHAPYLDGLPYPSGNTGKPQRCPPAGAALLDQPGEIARPEAEKKEAAVRPRDDDLPQLPRSRIATRLGIEDFDDNLLADVPAVFLPALVSHVAYLGRPVHLVGVDPVLLLELLSQGRMKGLRGKGSPPDKEILLEVMSHFIGLPDDRLEKAGRPGITRHPEVAEELDLDGRARRARRDDRRPDTPESAVECEPCSHEVVGECIQDHVPRTEACRTIGPGPDRVRLGEVRLIDRPRRSEDPVDLGIGVTQPCIGRVVDLHLDELFPRDDGKLFQEIQGISL